MRRLFLPSLLALLASCSCRGDEFAWWHEAKTSHFTVYSQASASSARSTLVQLEKLRSLFETGESPLRLEHPRSESILRVIEFRSGKEYDRYRLRPNADALYAARDANDFIVMPAVSEEQQLSVAAHEYSHMIVHRAGIQLPAWLNEGFADLFSSVQFTDNECLIGGELPGRTAILRRERWPSLQLLLAQPGPPQQSRKAAELYYAESWALTSLLVSAPAYAPRFPVFFALVRNRASVEDALWTALGKSLSMVEKDLHSWVRQRSFPLIRACTVSISLPPIEESSVSRHAARLLLGEMLMASGDFERANDIYQTEARIAPSDPNVFAALGTIAFHRGNKPEALRLWQQAITLGVDDADLMYRFAVLAEEADVTPEQSIAALTRAVGLRPGFDDARFKLALLESTAGEFANALTQLQAMRTVTRERAFGYWAAYAYAATELDRRDEAKLAARKAAEYARNDSEQAFASRLSLEASTDLTVQLTKRADGQLQMVTARKPHGAADWNPFIQPDDDLRQTTGKLHSVDCANGRIQSFSIETQTGPLTLSVEDPNRVLMSHAPREFYCGAQQDQAVQVDYAAIAKQPGSGVLRGMRFP